jgi:hypothetical protein
MGIADLPAEVLRSLPSFSTPKSEKKEESKRVSRRSTDTASSGRKRSLSADGSVASSTTSTSLVTPAAGGGLEEGSKGEDAASVVSVESPAKYELKFQTGRFLQRPTFPLTLSATSKFLQRKGKGCLHRHNRFGDCCDRGGFKAGPCGTEDSNEACTGHRQRIS